MAAPMRIHIFSWGANSYGQLGHGNCDDHSIPTEIQGLRNGGLRIVAGGGHTFFLLGDNSIKSCGWNNMGQLAQNSDKVPRPLHVTVATSTELDCQISKLACGWDFTVACVDGGKYDGQLLVWGSNTFGQLGLLKETVHKLTPIAIPLQLPDKVVEVAAGMRHAVAVTATGSVYTWGNGKKGQLGILLPTDVVPKQSLPSQVNIDCLTNTIKAVAGAYHSACLTSSGAVFVWGDNKHGQMTLDPASALSVTTPQMINPDYFGKRKVVDLHSGWTHMLAVLDNGLVYSWGRNDYGQLGRTTNNNFDYIPREVEGICSPTQLCCGSEHNLILTGDNRVWSWGWNEHGICGTGDEENVLKPTLIKFFSSEKVIGISCGMGHSFAITEDCGSVSNTSR